MCSEFAPSVNKVNLGRDVFEVEGPVDSGVTASDNNHPLVPEHPLVPDRVVDTLVLKPLNRGVPKFTRCKRSMSGGDEHGFGEVDALVSGQLDYSAVKPRQVKNSLGEMESRVVCARLLIQIFRQIFGQYFRESCDVVDEFIWVKGCQLPAIGVQSLNHFRLHTSHTRGIESREQACGSGADYGDVVNIKRLHGHLQLCTCADLSLPRHIRLYG
ncbi:hypothetical protein HRbin03_00152 [archaeon HR03]|nr:hypothetical protein HRbin03_00152 [archaeon HR03]